MSASRKAADPYGRTVRSPFAALTIAMRLIAAALFIAAAETPASAIQLATCSEPRIFSGADVNTVILQYVYAGKANSPLSETARRLTLLIQQDALLSQLKFRSIGVSFLLHDSSEECSAEAVAEKLLPQLLPGKGIVILSGQLLEREDQLYVQSFLEFGLAGADGTLRLPAGQPPTSEFLLGRLPGQALAFAPRRLSSNDIASIEQNFSRASVVRSEPSEASPGTPLALTVDDLFGYYVTEVQLPWVRVEPIEGYSGPSGWLRHDDNLRLRLRERMPELHALEAVAGYLRFVISRMPDSRPMDTADIESVQSNAAAFVEQALLNKDAEAVPAAIVASAGGVVEAIDRGLARVEGNPFSLAAELMPYSGDARNLKAAVEFAKCCMSGRAGWDEATAIEKEFLGALAIDPGNLPLLSNLRTYYGAAIPQFEPTAAGAEQLRRRFDAVTAALCDPRNFEQPGKRNFFELNCMQ